MADVISRASEKLLEERILSFLDTINNDTDEEGCSPLFTIIRLITLDEIPQEAPKSCPSPCSLQH